MRPGTSIKTTCPYCGVGCGVEARPGEGRAVEINGDSDHPANFGRLCSKGSALGETVGLEGRLLYPEVNGERASWNEALDLVANRFSQTIKEHGSDSVAFYVSGQILTEDYYVANKLMKGFIGSANIDTNSRLCMASSVAGHRKAFGTDTVPGTYEDLELADLIVLVGSNLAWCHPVLYQRIEAAKRARPSMKVVLVDPRRTMTANLADLHLGIAPDGDTTLFAGLLSYLADNDMVDIDYIARHTNGFEACLQAAKSISGPELLQQTGLCASEIGAFYSLFASTEKTVTIYSQGVNQSVSGTDKVSAILNCHLATARIGKPGMGPFSVTGQPNAMGGREVGGLANMLACHMDIENPEHRDLVKGFWNAPHMPDAPGLKAVDMFKGVADGSIKALWIMSTNPVDSLPEADTVAAALRTCPFVVVSDIVTDTDTMQYADVKLPAAAWGEKSGTVTNSERRISRQRQFLPWPGEAKPDWWQLAEVGKRMGFAGAFDYTRPSEIFDEYAKLSTLKNDGQRDFDIGGMVGMSEQSYEDLAPVQWPQRFSADPAISTRFFANGKFYTPDAKARFVAVAPSVSVVTNKATPFILNTGRVRDHWHTMTRSGLSERLSSHLAEPYCELHPKDADELGVRAASLLELGNTHGRVTLRALITDRVQQGSVFVPMHWTDQFASNGRVDTLVPARLDPYSGQPASKNVAVAVKPLHASTYAFLVSKTKPEFSNVNVLYWASAKCLGGWRSELAFKSRSDALVFAERYADTLSGGHIIDYNDPDSGDHRIAGFDHNRLYYACYLATEPVLLSREWAVEQLSTDFRLPFKRQAVLAGRADATLPDKGPIVCSCMSVGANEIQQVLHSGNLSVQAIGETTTAGTNCGSCRAEINGMINDYIRETKIAAE